MVFAFLVLMGSAVEQIICMEKQKTQNRTHNVIRMQRGQLLYSHRAIFSICDYNWSCITPFLSPVWSWESKDSFLDTIAFFQRLGIPKYWLSCMLSIFPIPCELCHTLHSQAELVTISIQVLYKLSQEIWVELKIMHCMNWSETVISESALINASILYHLFTVSNFSTCTNNHSSVILTVDARGNSFIQQFHSLYYIILCSCIS